MPTAPRHPIDPREAQRIERRIVLALCMAVAACLALAVVGVLWIFLNG